MTDSGIKAFERLTLREKWERVLEPVIQVGVERGILPMAIIAMQTAPQDGSMLVGKPIIFVIGQHAMLDEDEDRRRHYLVGLFGSIAEGYALGNSNIIDQFEVDFSDREDDES